MKKIWTYNYQKGLRGALVSRQIIKKDNFLYFILCYDKKSFFESVLIKYNRNSMEGEVIFKENHVIRSAGIYECGKFYFTSLSGIAYCVKDNGEIIWNVPIGEGNADINIEDDGDVLFTANHGIYCIDKKTGNILWSNEENKNKTGCTFAIDANYIYHAGVESAIRCIDKKKGKTVWSFGRNLYVSNCLLLDDNCLMVCNIEGKFMFFESATGKLLSEHEAKGTLYKKPVFKNSKMYMGDGSGNMTCYEMHENYKMNELFSFKTNGTITTNAIIDEEILYFASEDGYLYCLDANTGEQLCKKKKTAGIARDILIEKEDIIVLSDKGQIECFSK